MAAEGKPTPSRADFPSSIKMHHSLSAAWHHSEMDALGREREQTHIPAPNIFSKCMECYLNNVISTQPHQLRCGSDHNSHQGPQEGTNRVWEWGPLSIPSCTHPFMPQGQEIYNCGLQREKVPIRPELPFIKGFLQWEGERESGQERFQGTSKQQGASHSKSAQQFHCTKQK